MLRAVDVALLAPDAKATSATSTLISSQRPAKLPPALSAINATSSLPTPGAFPRGGCGRFARPRKGFTLLNAGELSRLRGV
jgi:hypothetical protein